MPFRSAGNPLLVDWYTPFTVAPFPKILPEHYLPAFAAALKEHRTEIRQITRNVQLPTFANTIAALENSGRLLRRISHVFWNLTDAHTNSELQAIEREIAPQFAVHWNAIMTSGPLFKRIAVLHLHRHRLKLNPERLRVLERTHLAFVRAGAALPAKSKKRMGEIKERLATLGTQFGQNVLADEQSFTLELEGEADLAGLPDFVRAAARGAAEQRNRPGSHVVTLSRSLIEPFLTFSARRDLRERTFKAWIKRGENGGATDNRAVVAETLALRSERARLLGYETFAAYRLDDSMAKTPKAVQDLLDTVWRPAVARAAKELAKLQAQAAKEGANTELEPWDWRYWAEKVRAAEFDLDEAQIKPYLPLERTIAAAFHTAERLFGLTFHERSDVPVYHPDVRVWEAKDASGSSTGLFLGDYFARPEKRSGAWMNIYRGQERRYSRNVRPIVVNVMNFAKGEGDIPALLSLEDARTLFHEFGHALHALLSNVTYPSLAGTQVAKDFVELPSQLFEHWLTTPEILSRFARHYVTDAPMPKALIDKIRAARTFNQGFATVEYLASALVDMAFHAAADPADPMAFEAATLQRLGLPKQIVMRHRTPHFAHIFSGGYAAGYYSYLWSEVLDADAFAAFSETGDVFDADTAAKLKTFIYSAGGLRPEDEAYTAFRGRLPTIDGLLAKRGLVAGQS